MLTLRSHFKTTDNIRPHKKTQSRYIISQIRSKHLRQHTLPTIQPLRLPPQHIRSEPPKCRLDPPLSIRVPRQRPIRRIRPCQEPRLPADKQPAGREEQVRCEVAQRSRSEEGRDVWNWLYHHLAISVYSINNRRSPPADGRISAALCVQDKDTYRSSHPETAPRPASPAP